LTSIPLSSLVSGSAFMSHGMTAVREGVPIAFQLLLDSAECFRTVFLPVATRLPNLRGGTPFYRVASSRINSFDRLGDTVTWYCILVQDNIAESKWVAHERSFQQRSAFRYETQTMGSNDLV
jgi:hypothetical protein